MVRVIETAFYQRRGVPPYTCPPTPHAELQPLLDGTLSRSTDLERRLKLREVGSVPHGERLDAVIAVMVGPSVVAFRERGRGRDICITWGNHGVDD